MSNIKIAIVEDEWTIAEHLKTCLTNMDYDTTSIEDTGEGAIRSVEEDRPDMVLIDIVLKGEMSGIEAAGQIHDRFNIPHIFITAHADKKILDQAKLTEPSGYIVKPFDERELNAVIEMGLYKHKIEAELKIKTEKIEEMNKYFINRELKMIELKKEIEALKHEREELKKEQKT